MIRHKASVRLEEMMTRMPNVGFNAPARKAPLAESVLDSPCCGKGPAAYRTLNSVQARAANLSMTGALRPCLRWCIGRTEHLLGIHR